ncbi:hypothetical protein LZ24_02105 [Desulfobotulus alkaliphilus]|uniref:Uncharacterized protein n=1 Tax=Desulfobotulus alkaliphilus TaxID=622671 RepID=A0A562RS33_9BACT|nr:hypothetical protein [Desulfobotulus alkaliphilus]TWI71140.1 hypothetical protein LZ24_02105 [Desulfobotulus alkaliphilus]
MSLRENNDHTAFETERLQKRMDGLSFRLTLALLVTAGLLAGILFTLYARVQQDMKAIHLQQAAVLSDSKPLEQKVFELSARFEDLSDILSQQTQALSRLQQLMEETRKNAQEQNKTLSSQIKEFDRRLASVENQEKPDAGILKTLSENLTRTRNTLQAEQEERKKLAAELAAQTRENTRLRQVQENQKNELAQLLKSTKEMEQARKRDTQLLQNLQKEQQNLKNNFEIPADVARKSDLDNIIRRSENERASLENRINRKFQQLQVALDAALRGGSPAADGSRTPVAPIVEQELLTE